MRTNLTAYAGRDFRSRVTFHAEVAIGQPRKTGTKLIYCVIGVPRAAATKCRDLLGYQKKCEFGQKGLSSCIEYLVDAVTTV
jgi:hypothetical protein